MPDRNDASDRVAEACSRVRARDRRAIARVITAVENDTGDAHAIVAALRQFPGHARIVGITGPPGAGKSTLVSALVGELRRHDRSVAVVAIDPSSPISGGAVLGDRVRMAGVHDDDGVFIRSLAARGHLGGLTRTTHDVVTVLDAAGFDDVIVETVGAGQSEVAIAKIATTRIVVCPPGLGDEVQAMKAGILEIADILVVNKSDLPGAERTEQELRAMIALRGAAMAKPAVIRTVAMTGEGVGALASEIERHAATALARDTIRVAVSGAADADSAYELERTLAARDRYMAHLGAELVSGGLGRATVSMRVRPEHLNFMGGCHGGALFSLADMALGLACNSHATMSALIDAHVTFPVPVLEGDRLVANAQEFARSRRLARYRIEVTRDEEMVASMAATVYVTGKALSE